MDDNEIFETDEQIILSIISIGTIIVSIILLFNERTKLTKEKGFLSQKEEYDLTLFNRIILFIIFFIFLAINYKTYIKVINEGKEDPKPFLLQLYAGILTLGATIITLYVSYITKNNINVDIENPVI